MESMKSLSEVPPFVEEEPQNTEEGCALEKLPDDSALHLQNEITSDLGKVGLADRGIERVKSLSEVPPFAEPKNTEGGASEKLSDDSALHLQSEITSDFRRVGSAAVESIKSIKSFSKLSPLVEPKDTEGCVFGKLSDDSDLHRQITSDFLEIGVTVESIDRVQSHALWERYTKKRKDSEILNLKTKEDNFEFNEAYLYHGTSSDQRELLKEHFDIELSSDGDFGRGIYLSDTPKYFVEKAENRSIVVARVILGTVKEYEDGAKDLLLSRAPDKTVTHSKGTRFYGSVKGRPKDDTVYVVYNDKSVLIEYIVYFTQPSKPQTQDPENGSEHNTDGPAYSQTATVAYQNDGHSLKSQATLAENKRERKSKSKSRMKLKSFFDFFNFNEWNKEGPAFTDRRVNRLCVKIDAADIVQLHVDVIVSVMYGRSRRTLDVQMEAGIAGAIFRAGGQHVQRECRSQFMEMRRFKVTGHVATGGGNLPSKNIYHVVGPRWNNYRGRRFACKRDLRRTILKCLLHAECDGHRDIAIPFIGSGKARMPLGYCAESYMKAVQHFEMMRDTNSLQAVHFVEKNDEIVGAIREKSEYYRSTPLVGKHKREFKKDKKRYWSNGNRVGTGNI